MNLVRKLVPQIHRALIVCSAHLWSNADIAPQNYRAIQTLNRKKCWDIVTGTIFFLFIQSDFLPFKKIGRYWG